MEVLTGILLILFVAMVSVTIVGNALPTMMAALHGTETHYTWVVTASLLASTAATPIAGRLGDIIDLKKLLMASIGIFTLGSIVCGTAQSATMLIFMRVLQGAGMGSLMAVVQTVLARIIPPRERGRYNGYMGGTMALATVSGPLIGGFIVATPGLGWRWCFWSAIPFAIFAAVILWFKLEIPGGKPLQRGRIDYMGAALVILAVSTSLIWLSLSGKNFDYISTPSLVLLTVAVVALVLFIIVERRAEQPVVPLHLFRQRTTLLAIIASVAVGTSMNSSPVFFGQYFQVARGMNPAVAGLATIPLMLGSFLASTGAGQMVSRKGKWKPYVVGGVVTMTTGVTLVAFMGAHTPMPLLWIAMFLIGAGQGASMQNLILAVQNTVALKDIGASTATVTFFRSLGGSVGIQVAGIVFAKDVAERMTSGFSRFGGHAPMTEHGGTMDFSKLPPKALEIVRDSYGDAISVVFTVLAIVGIAGVLAVLGMKSSVLRGTLDKDVEKKVRAVLDADAAEDSATGTGETAQTGAAEDAPADKAADSPTGTTADPR